MKPTPDLIRYEFIGTQAEVSRSKHSGYLGLSGKIIDETRNTFTILNEEKQRQSQRTRQFSISNFLTEQLSKLTEKYLWGDQKTASKNI